MKNPLLKTATPRRPQWEPWSTDTDFLAELARYQQPMLTQPTGDSQSRINANPQNSFGAKHNVKKWLTTASLLQKKVAGVPPFNPEELCKCDHPRKGHNMFGCQYRRKDSNTMCGCSGFRPNKPGNPETGPWHPTEEEQLAECVHCGQDATTVCPECDSTFCKKCWPRHYKDSPECLVYQPGQPLDPNKKAFKGIREQNELAERFRRKHDRFPTEAEFSEMENAMARKKPNTLSLDQRNELLSKGYSRDTLDAIPQGDTYTQSELAVQRGRRKHQSPPNMSPASPAQPAVTCPRCGHSIKAKDTYCKACGVTLKKAPAPAAPTPAPAEAAPAVAQKARIDAVTKNDLLTLGYHFDDFSNMTQDEVDKILKEGIFAGGRRPLRTSSLAEKLGWKKVQGGYKHPKLGSLAVKGKAWQLQQGGKVVASGSSDTSWRVAARKLARENKPPMPYHTPSGECQCENNHGEHDDHSCPNGACNIVETTYGNFDMCYDCAQAVSPEFLKGHQQQWVLKRDGTIVLGPCTDIEITQYIHRNHSYSMSHALAHEGYSIAKAQPGDAVGNPTFSKDDQEMMKRMGIQANKAWKMRPPTGDAPKLLKERIGKTEWHSHDMSLAQHHPKCQCARCEPMGRPCDCKHCRALRVSQGKRAGWQNPLLKKADETALARVSKMETVGRQMVEKLREENSRKRNSMPEGFDFVGPAVSCSDWLTAMLRSIPNLMSMNIDYDLLLKELGKVWEKVKPGDDEEIPEPPAKMDSPLIVGE